MPLPTIQPALGVVNNANQSFTTETPYIAGSLRVLRNGIFQVDEHVETGADSFDVLFVPRGGERVGAYYDKVP